MTDPSGSPGTRQHGYNQNELATLAGFGPQFGLTPNPIGSRVPWTKQLAIPKRGQIGQDVSVEWAAQQIYSMSQEEYNFLGQMMQIHNQNDTSYDRSAIQYEWINRIVPETVAYNAATNSNVNPFEFAQLRNGDAPMPVKDSGGAGYSRVIDLTNPSDAKVLADNALSTYLGRAANEDETEMFLSTLNKVERRNPIVTTPSGRTGGVNTQQVAKEFAQSQEGAAEYLASTKYMDWFMEKLASDPTEGIESGL